MERNYSTDIPGTTMPYIGVPFSGPSGRPYLENIGTPDPKIDEISPSLAFSLSRLPDEEERCVATQSIEPKKDRKEIKLPGWFTRLFL